RRGGAGGGRGGVASPGRGSGAGPRGRAPPARRAAAAAGRAGPVPGGRRLAGSHGGADGGGPGHGPGGPAGPRHRPPPRPVPGMSGESTAAAPRPRRKPVFGPEPWREGRGRPWSHWDLWFCLVLASEFDEDWAAFSEEVWRRRSPYLLTRDEESKVSHLEDLQARLADVGLVAADLVGVAAGDRKLLAKARRKVLDQPLNRGRDLTPARWATPRERLWCRALRGHWERFPVSPASAHARFADRVARARRRGRGGYGIAQALQGLLDGQDRRLTGDPAARLALWRGLLTAGIEALGEVRDRDGELAGFLGGGLPPPPRGGRGRGRGGGGGGAW